MISAKLSCEALVLATMLLDPTKIDGVKDFLGVEDFENLTNKNIFLQILKAHNQKLKIDCFTVATEIFNATGIDLLSLLLEYIKELPTAECWLAYANQVKERSRRNKLQEIYKNGLKNQTTSADQQVLNLTEQLKKIEANTFFDLPSMVSRMQRAVQKLDEMANDDKFSVLQTGYEALDKITNGFRQKHLVILAARPSMGKTTFAINCATNIAINYQKPVLFFSLEMPAEDIDNRIISRYLKIEGEKIFDPKRMEAKDWARLEMIQPCFEEKPFFLIDKTPMNISDIRRACNQMKNTHGLAAVFVDYLSLIEGGIGENETLRIGNLSAQLKNLAKDFDVPVVALSQLNRGLEQRVDKRPVMSDLRQSGEVEQNADLILFIYRDVVYNPNTLDKNTADIIIAKNRNGKTGKCKLTTNLNYFEFLINDTVNHP